MFCSEISRLIEIEKIEKLKVASVETPGLKEDDRQDTLTEDGQDGRYTSCTDALPKRVYILSNL